MRDCECIQNFVHKVEGEREIERPDETGCESVDWIQLAQDKFQEQDSVNL
jgi:hypothetical protein